MILLSIDPGVHACGWAKFEGKKLVCCGLDPLDRIMMGADTIVIEKPQIYRGTVSKGDPNDLIDLAIVVGRLQERCGGRARLVLPREWKGNTPKKMMTERILCQLTPDEKVCLPKLPKSRLHNVVDAIGIGIWKLLL